MASEIYNVIDALSRVPDLRVVARTSAFAFKGKANDVRQIARQLNVGAVLEGSVRKSGDRLRITAQLNRAGDGYLPQAQNRADDLVLRNDRRVKRLACEFERGCGHAEGFFRHVQRQDFDLPATARQA